MRRYAHTHLDESQLAWIVRARIRGLKNADVAGALGISERWVKHVYAYYRKNGFVPIIKKPGRPRVEIPNEERIAIRDALKRYGVGACYLVPVIRNTYGVGTNHMRVYQVMKEEGLLWYRAKRYVRKKWIRYEREYSNELWHTDWHEMEHPSYKGKQLIVYEDDASRFILGYGLFDSESSENSVSVLKATIKEHGKPIEILTDRGATFYAVEAEARVKGLTKFELYLMSNRIEQTLCGVRHPQTNGKLEKLFDTIETGLERGFIPIERCMEWYNTMKPHGSLDLERAETPVQAYYRKMKERDALIDPSSVFGGEVIL